MCQKYYCQTDTNWHKLRKQIKFPIHIRLNFISRFVFFFEANRTSRGFLFHNLTNYTYIPLSLIAKINWLIFVTALLMSKVLLTSKMALFFNDFYLLSYTVFHWVHKKIYEQEIFLFFSFRVIILVNDCPIAVGVGDVIECAASLVTWVRLVSLIGGATGGNENLSTSLSGLRLRVWRHIQNLCGFSTPTTMGQSFIMTL
jgi:hypothetical protein